jgi:hypothetical protein
MQTDSAEAEADEWNAQTMLMFSTACMWGCKLSADGLRTKRLLLFSNICKSRTALGSSGSYASSMRPFPFRLLL